MGGSVTSGTVNGTTPVPGPTPSPPPVPSPPQQCDKCVCSPGMNNGGHNMQNAVRADNETHCCDFCQQTKGCVGWTFIPKDGNACWLKDQIDGLQADGLVTSGSIGTVPPPSPVPPTPVPVPPTPVPVPPTPTPTPSDCPGGSLDACIDLCPTDDTALFHACVKSCQKRCKETILL